MSRRFRPHELRWTQALHGLWDFAFLGDVHPDNVDISAIRYDDRMVVPGCFDATPAYAGRRGLAAYRTRLGPTDAARYRLMLDGVHHWCRAFINGVPIGEHIGGFTRFGFDLPSDISDEAELTILVDNRFDPDRCPLHHGYFDWYQYGGIARGASIHRLGFTWIESVAIDTEDLYRRQLAVTVRYGTDIAPAQAVLAIHVDGHEVLREALTLSEPTGEIRRSVEVPGASLWSPESPHLHLMQVRLGEDDLIERFGIRQVRVDGREILINDKPIRLLGFCRHEAHPQFGHSLPDSLILSDVQQLLDLGANFVRGSHYPQDSRFLDLCDEAGLCVWSEAIGWQHPASHLTDDRFLQAQIAHIDEMIAAARNHPSVIMWGILNESHSHDAACRPGYETLLSHIRELDPSRPVTYASNHPFNDLCLDLVDIVSINTYPGWYHGEIEDIPDHLDAIVQHLDRSGFDDRPMIISEIGAGAIPGWRDAHETRWSEQYQAQLLDRAIHHLFVDRDRVRGLSIWQFCDCRTSEEVGRILMRPRGFNNKGVVDEYRRPKLAYETVRRHFRQLREKRPGTGRGPISDASGV